MSAYPAWTPAPRPGIVPLHPLSFGTILGRSFVALRQNPRVLLGFALVVQIVSYLVVIVAVGAVGIASFARLDTVTPGSDEFEQILAGSITLTALAGFVLGLSAGALTVIVQGVVVTEVAHAVLAEKLPLGRLWRQVRPVAWRLVGYALALGLFTVAAVALAVGALVAISAVAPVAIALGVLLVLGSIPLTLWLSTKLLLAPAAIILERATIRDAVVRSWTLVRGRFWAALGIIVLISLVFGAVAQVVGLPFSFLASGLGTIIAPTGAEDVTGLIGLLVVMLLAQAATLLIQAVATVVQSTATALVYVDCRMRHEALDLDLLAYIERRDAGAANLPDPYTVGIGRVAQRDAPFGGAYPFAYDPRYAGRFGHAGAPVYAPPPGYAPPQPPPAHAYAPPAAAPVVPPPAPAPATRDDDPPAGDAPTRWTAPGPHPADGEGGWR